jgi:hypothetical protein
MPIGKDMAVTATLRGQFPTRPAEVMPPSRREQTVFAFVMATLVLPPWLIGGRENWAQWITLMLAVLAFAALFTPMADFRAWPVSPTARIGWRRLVKFPVFWIGLAILVYGITAALNPSRVFVVAGSRAWLEATPHVWWLPQSITSSFWPMNAWRALLMIVPAWLATCSAWAGLETEQAWQRLLGAVAVNGLLLALFGIIQRLAGAQEMFWFYFPQSTNGAQTFFGSFVYAGHAAAWMVLAFGAAAAMIDRHLRQRDPLAAPARWGWPALSAWIWLAALAVILVALAVFVKPVFWLLAAGGVLVIYTWLWLRRWWLEGQKRRAALYALPALVFMALLLGTTVGTAWWWRQGGSGASLQVNPQDASLPIRYAIARTSASMVKKEPVWGWGPGSFRYVAPFYLRKNPLFADPDHPGDLLYTSSYAHSDWVQIPAEWGLAGAILFAALPAWWFAQAWRLRRILPGESWIMLGTVALIFAGAAADFPFYNLAVLIAVGVLTATAVKLGVIAARPRPLLSKVMVVCP